MSKGMPDASVHINPMPGHNICRLSGMRKSYPYLILIFCVLLSCKHRRRDAAVSADNKKEIKITRRNRSVSPQNSYSDIFFDSARLVEFIATHQVNDTIARRMTGFYNSRNYQYAWFSSDGLTEQGRGFWNLYQYHTTYSNDTLLKDKVLEKEMGDLVAEDSLKVSSADENILQAEVNLTRYFIIYAMNNIKEGYVKRKELEHFVPAKKLAPLALADTLLNKKHKDNKYYSDVNEPYKLLKVALGQYLAIAKTGGWAAIPGSEKDFKIGNASPGIIQLKRRLLLTGDMPADTGYIYNEALVQGIKNFQLRHGFTSDGKITDAILREMNVTVEARIKQLLINMGRMQWMIDQPTGRLIVVNIPEYILHVKENGKDAWTMNVVVGKEGHNTTIFTGNLNEVVFSPYWNVPVSIVKKEILPGIRKNKHYLENHHMEIVRNGSIPDIRQLPGKDNSLGKVKFLFPNSFDIYFHDTPAKSLFTKDQRAYSHGCIRLKEPAKMAEYILADNPKWTVQAIDSAMNLKQESRVRVKNPVPVLITYYTAWVDERGKLHFAGDIYGHDADVSSKMFF